MSTEFYQKFSFPPSVMMNQIAQVDNTICSNITVIYIVDSTKHKLRTVSD